MKIKMRYLFTLLAACCITSFLSSTNGSLNPISVQLNPISNLYFTSCNYYPTTYDTLACAVKPSYMQKFPNSQQLRGYMPPGATTYSYSVVLRACSSCDKTQFCTTTKPNEQTMVGQYQNPSGTGYCLMWAAPDSATDYNTNLS